MQRRKLAVFLRKMALIYFQKPINYLWNKEDRIYEIDYSSKSIYAD